MKHARIWPTLTVLSVVILSALAISICGEHGIILPDWVTELAAQRAEAAECDACVEAHTLEPLAQSNQSPSNDGPRLTPISEDAGPTLVAPMIAQTAAPSDADAARSPRFAQKENIAAPFALADAAEVNTQQPHLAAPATDDRYANRYATPVSHTTPADKGATHESNPAPVATDSAYAETTEDGSAHEESSDADLTTRPLPPVELQPVQEGGPRYTVGPIVSIAPNRAATTAVTTSDESDTESSMSRYPSSAPPMPIAGSGNSAVERAAALAAEPTKQNHSAELRPLAGGNKQSGMTLKWILPRAITLGQESACQLQVRNATDATAQSVTVSVQLSPGARVEHVEPRPTAAEGNTLTWELGDISAGAGTGIQLGIVPEEQGEFAPVASVTCTRSVAAKTPIVEPRLAMIVEGPNEAVVGQNTTFHVRVNNQGTGAATGVAIELRLAEGLEGAAGFKPRYEIGTLAPGENRQVQVTVTGRDKGNFTISGQTILGDAPAAAATHAVRMNRPSLAVAVDGPKLRFVDRKAEYTIKVQNPGPGAIDNVQLQETIPAGFRFVEASSGGSFDREARQVAWFVGHLEPNETANVAVHLVAIEAGEHKLNAEAKADFGVAGEGEATTTVRGAPRVVIDVTEDDDPVEVDGETVYRVRLTNMGSMPAHGVQFAGEAPPEMKLLKVNGPAEGTIRGQQVVFPAVETLGPGETASYDVHVKCRKAGQVQFKAYFRSQDNPTPVLEEEMTRIYAE